MNSIPELPKELQTLNKLSEELNDTNECILVFDSIEDVNDVSYEVKNYFPNGAATYSAFEKLPDKEFSGNEIWREAHKRGFMQYRIFDKTFHFIRADKMDNTDYGIPVINYAKYKTA